MEMVRWIDKLRQSHCQFKCLLLVHLKFFLSLWKLRHTTYLGHKKNDNKYYQNTYSIMLYFENITLVGTYIST